MVWLQVEDVENYTNESIEKFKRDYKKDNVIFFPDEKTIQDNIRPNSLFIASYDVPKAYKNLIPQVRIFSKYGALTSQEKDLDISESEALGLRMGLTIIDSHLTMDNVGGAQLLKEWTRDYIKAYNNGYKAKAIMLAGLPGTGKTFFTKALAGETKRKLVFLNLSYLMTKDEPIAELCRIHEFLDQYRDDKYIILLDEIEKMIGNGTADEKQLLGAFLTILNEMNTPSSKYKFDAIYVATANNLTSLLVENPEFLRRGRFDELFFLNLPNSNDAKSTIELYANIYGFKDEVDEITISELMYTINSHYKDCQLEPNRFAYSPAEIETLFKLLDFQRKAEKEINIDTFKEVIELVIPLTKSAREGLEKMIAQKELFKEI